MASLPSIFMDKKHWGDPENFRPERFLNSQGCFIADDWIAPFGFGIVLIFIIFLRFLLN